MADQATSLLIQPAGNDVKGGSNRGFFRRRKNIYFLALWTLIGSAILVTAAFAVGTVSISLDSPDDVGEIETTESVDYSHVNRIQSRKKRDVVNKVKEESEQAIMKLMDDPNCKEDCKKLQKQLVNLDTTIETAMVQLKVLKTEIDKVSKVCTNRTSMEEDSGEVQLRLSPVGSSVLEDVSGRTNNDVIDHDLAGSQQYLAAYPWPPAEQQPEAKQSIPPTGPDSSVVGEPTASGPGETVQTSQQMTVSLPQTLQRICSMVPGPPGSSGYVCTPAHNLLSQEQPSGGNFYLQVLGRSQTHVPTAISAPNPFAFPTLSGSPVVVPASAAPPGQLVPVFNPKSGQIYLQNYQQSPSTAPFAAPQFVVPPQQQQQVFPVQQYVVAQFTPAVYRPNTVFQPQYHPPVVRPQVLYQQIPLQQQYSPQVYQPQVYLPQPNPDPMLQCAYVIVPNTPVKTYKFPTVPGVSETIQRSEHSKGGKNIHHRTDNTTKPKMNEIDNCPPGSRPCADESACIQEDEWCDSKIDCLDFSDENRCNCRERILPDKLCDGYFDCPRGEDELGCFGCRNDMFSCDDLNEEERTMTCLPMERRCDSMSDCPNDKDEVGCTLITDEYNLNDMPAISYTKGFLFKNWKGKWYPVCTAITWQTEACKEELLYLSRYPEVRHVEMTGYNGLLANEMGASVELVSSCLVPGSALWVDCPQPECGIKRVSQRARREKRDLGSSKGHWVDHYPHTEDPSFQTTPEAIQFVKNFFNSMSIFDKKKFYKRLWGPLVQPYMGLKDRSVTENEEHTRNTIDPTQSSWQYYLHPHDQAIAGYYPQEYNQEYQQLDPNTEMQSYYPAPFGSYYYEDQEGNYINSYNEAPFLQNYVRSLRNIEEDRSEDMLRVVGGSRSEPGAWPWLVVMYRDGIFHCGGTILTPTVVLTAAHCVYDFEDHYYEVQGGVLRRFSFSPQEQIRRVEQVILHEHYDSSTMLNDVAVMRLSTPLKFNRWVLPICLPPPQMPLQPPLPLPDTICTAIGWGAVFEHGPDPDHLREVEVPVLPNCPHRSDELGHEICAGYPGGGMDTCQGDSGGPLLCKLTEEKWYIAGIVSHGEGCARLGEPGVYTRVSMFRKWIEDHLVWPQGMSKASSKECPGPMCDSGRCLPEGSRCDSHIDCLHGEDELNCGLLSDPLPDGRSVESLSNITSSDNFEIYSTTETEKESGISTGQELLSTTAEELSSMSEDEPNLSTTEPTAEEAVIHSEQTRSVDISNLFSCKKLNQRIISSRVCDKILDCVDGSDEVGCSCKDHLQHISPNLICNGRIDCRDSSDEKECPGKCKINEFYCHESDFCIPKEKQCDLKKDCHFGEDEIDCYALIQDELQFDEVGRPKLLANGTAIIFSKGSWRKICDIPNPSATAIHVCHHIGFSITRDYKVEMRQDPLLGGDVPGPCASLFVECSSPKSKLWLAPVFSSGSPLTLAILVSPSWLLSPIAGLELPQSDVYLNTWLGKSDLNLNIKGPYDQYIHIDGLTTIGDTEVTLLHLEHPVAMNHKIAPLPFPDWPTPVNEKESCEAVGMTKDGEVMSVRLRPVTCSEEFRCYTLLDEEPSVCEMIGVVVCNSSFGSYVTAALSTNICHSTIIKLPDIVKDRSIFNQQIENDLFDRLEDDFCDTTRCETGKCLDWSEIGDGIPDCFDSQDETEDMWLKKKQFCSDNETDCSLGCRPGELKCKSGECISASKFCDGKTDCEDGSDEERCDCAGYLSLTHPALLCDGSQNCIDKSDELWADCLNNTDCSSSDKFNCHLSGSSIPTSFVCDGEEDCQQGEDEKSCIALRSPPDKPKEGLVFSRLYGQLVPQCLDSHDDLAERICQRKNGLKSDENGLKSFHYGQVPYYFVLTDAFTVVRLNENTSISLRPSRPFSSIEQDQNINCTALYVICN